VSLLDLYFIYIYIYSALRICAVLTHCEIGQSTVDEVMGKKFVAYFLLQHAV